MGSPGTPVVMKGWVGRWKTERCLVDSAYQDHFVSYLVLLNQWIQLKIFAGLLRIMVISFIMVSDYSDPWLAPWRLIIVALWPWKLVSLDFSRGWPFKLETDIHFMFPWMSRSLIRCSWSDRRTWCPSILLSLRPYPGKHSSAAALAHRTFSNEPLWNSGTEGVPQMPLIPCLGVWPASVSRVCCRKTLSYRQMCGMVVHV